MDESKRKQFGNELVESIDKTIGSMMGLIGELEDTKRDGFCSQLLVDEFVPVVAVLGSNCSVLATEPFQQLIDEFIDSDPDWIRSNAPVWIDHLKLAAEKIEAALKSNTP